MERILERKQESHNPITSREISGVLSLGTIVSMLQGFENACLGEIWLAYR